MKTEDYKGIQDLDGVKVEIGSFHDPIFKTSTSISLGARDRTFKFYSGELYDVFNFDYSYDGGNEIYIRYKNRPHIEDQDIYLELVSRGKSSGGGKVHMGAHNPWAKYVKNIDIFIHGRQMLLNCGTNDFEFLQQVSDEEIIKRELERGYAKLPQNVVCVEYMCIDQQSGDIYCVTYPTFNFKYDNQRIMIIDINDNVSEGNITDYRTYRDGGTTYIEFELDDKKSTFYYPTIFGVSDGNGKVPTITDSNGSERPLTFGVNEETYNAVIKRLGLILEVNNDYKYVPKVIDRHNEYDNGLNI